MVPLVLTLLRTGAGQVVGPGRGVRNASADAPDQLRLDTPAKDSTPIREIVGILQAEIPSGAAVSTSTLKTRGTEGAPALMGPDVEWVGTYGTRISESPLP